MPNEIRCTRSGSSGYSPLNSSGSNFSDRPPINIFLHVSFVWPILFTTLVLLYFTPTILKVSLIGFNDVLLFNLGFVFTLIYAVFYNCLDKKSGSLVAFLCFLCWLASNFLASNYLLRISYFGVHIHTETHDLFQETSCPVSTGDFVIAHSQVLPGFTPPVWLNSHLSPHIYRKCCP